MAFILDFLLLAASGAACFYCWVLNTRIKALTSTKDGINTGIAALSQSADDMQAAMTNTKDQAAADSVKLEALIEDANKKIPELQMLASQIQEISERAVEETETATKHLIETLSPHIENARTAAHALLGSLEQASATPASTKTEVATDTVDETTPDENTAEASDDGVVELTFVADEEQQAVQGEVA
jgi:uncharacterized protein YoxC